MARKKRKIGFYSITVNDGNVQECWDNALDYLNRLEPTDKRRNIIGDKFGLLDSITLFNQTLRKQMIFKSATSNFRPPLIDRNTVAERESPKTLGEGEINKTHLISKVVDGELIVVLEKTINGLSIKQILNYINSFTETFSIPFSFNYELIVKENFIGEVNSLARINAAEVFVDKQLLGSDALNYSGRINSVKHEVMISIKAVNRESITDFVTDIYAKLNGGSREINRIRITGRNEDNNVVVLNTDVIERQEWVSPNVDDNTGEVVSSELLEQMEGVMNNF